MSEFAFLFLGGDDPGSPEKMQQHMQKWGVWMKELGAQGHFKGGAPLEKGGKIVRGREKVTTDGPFPEAKDLVGGYMLIEAADLAQATELSRGCPILDTNGTVQIRPVMKM